MAVQQLRRFIYGTCLASGILMFLTYQQVHIPMPTVDQAGIILEADQSEAKSIQEGESNHKPVPKPTCMIPKLNPWDPDLLPFISHPRVFNCSHIQPEFVYLDEDGDVGLTEVASAQNKSGTLHCRTEVLQNLPHNSFAREPWKELKSTQTVSFRDYDSIQVNCYNNSRQQMYTNTFNHPRRNIGRKILENSVNQLTVLIWFLDGVSFSMFQRHLPSTFEYLSNVMGFQWLQGQVKVADNSFPNMIPFFTGLRAGNQGRGLPAEVERKRYQTYDDFDLIWKRYAEKGYATSLFEDWPHVGIFFMETGGFKSAQPTDHYYFAYNKILEKSPLSDRSTRFCYGNDAKYDKALDTWRRLIRHYRSKRLFSMHMFTEMTHGFTSDLERADESFKRFFRELYEEGAFENSAIVAMSDHGARYPPFRHKLVGRLEDKLPTLGYFFPEEFRKNYPHVVQNLARNKHTLTTHYDSHQTLLDVLNADYAASEDANQKRKWERGLSQLRVLPIDRTCHEASVPDQYCACAKYVAINSTSEFALLLSNFLVSHINSLVLSANLTASCADLSLKTVISVERQSIDRKVSADTNSTVVLYRVTVVTQPGDARLEGTVEHNEMSHSMQITNTVDRINQYGNQSACIHDARMKLYCYCV